MSLFTSGEVGAALPLSKISDEDLALLLRVPRRDAATRRAELTKLHADEGWVRETLRQLPEAALVVLSIVAGHGGSIRVDLLADVARANYGMTVEEVHAGVGAAIAHVLLVLIESRWGEHVLCMISPAAALIAAQVEDLDLAELPRGELVPGEEPGGRALLAACMALRHVDVKLTQVGRPHRGGIKRLAKAIGVTDELLEEMVITAMAFGLLAIDEGQELLRPDVERLMHAAEGRYPGCAVAEALSAALERGPVSSEELLRSLVRSPPSFAAPVSASSFAHLPGFRVGTVGGVEAVGRDPIGDRAAGHVTPSFEVFLPPESRFTDIVRIGGCSELVRIDRMMVWRLTKASVRRSVSAGVGASEILAALAAASRTAVPQNVEAAIRDWEGGVATAALGRGRVIAVDPAVADRMRAVLADLDPRELVPGVFVVDERTPPDTIHARLRRADIASRAELTPVDREPRPSEARIGMGSPELRERVAAWRKRRQSARAGEVQPRPAAAPRGAPGAKAAPGAAVPRAAAPSRAPATVREPPDAAVSTTVQAVLDTMRRQLGPDPSLAAFEAMARMVVRGLGKKRDPLARKVTAQLEELIAQIASGELDEARFAEMLRGLAPAAAPLLPPPLRPPAVPPIAWVREKIGQRLQIIVPEAPLALDLGDTIRQIRFSRLLQRGDTWLVLGEDIDTADAVAVPLSRITGFAVIEGMAPAEPRDRDRDAAASPAPDPAPEPRRDSRAPSPAPNLPGHVRCPCGSGARYRDCCRP